MTNKPATQNLDYLLKFGFVNIRSINKNLEHLAIDQIMLQQEIIFVTETWKDPKNSKTLEIDGFYNAFANGKTPKGKGVGVFFKNDAKIDICEEEHYQL